MKKQIVGISVLSLIVFGLINEERLGIDTVNALSGEISPTTVEDITKNDYEYIEKDTIKEINFDGKTVKYYKFNLEKAQTVLMMVNGVTSSNKYTSIKDSIDVVIKDNSGKVVIKFDNYKYIDGDAYIIKEKLKEGEYTLEIQLNELDTQDKEVKYNILYADKIQDDIDAEEKEGFEYPYNTLDLKMLDTVSGLILSKGELYYKISVPYKEKVSGFLTAKIDGESKEANINGKLGISITGTKGVVKARSTNMDLLGINTECITEIELEKGEYLVTVYGKDLYNLNMYNTKLQVFDESSIDDNYKPIDNSISYGFNFSDIISSKGDILTIGEKTKISPKINSSSKDVKYKLEYFNDELNKYEDLEIDKGTGEYTFSGEDAKTYKFKYTVETNNIVKTKIKYITVVKDLVGQKLNLKTNRTYLLKGEPLNISYGIKGSNIDGIKYKVVYNKIYNDGTKSGDIIIQGYKNTKHKKYKFKYRGDYNIVVYAKSKYGVKTITKSKRVYVR